MSFISTVYEDFARLKYGMKSSKFKTPYTIVCCDSFNNACYFFHLASRMGLACAICSKEYDKYA